jgi:hypothetical protein
MKGKIMTLAVVMVLAWAAITLADGTPIGAALRRMLVEAPAQFLMRVRVGHVVVTAGLIVAVAAAIWLGRGDGAVLASMVMPEAMSFLMLVDAATLVDIALATILVVTTVRIEAIRIRIATALRRPRAPRTHKACVEREAANDDEEPRPALVA